MSKLTRSQLVVENDELRERLLRQHNFLYDAVMSVQSIRDEERAKWETQVKQLKQRVSVFEEDLLDLTVATEHGAVREEQLERLLFKAAAHINDEHYRSTARAHNDRLARLEGQIQGVGGILVDMGDLGHETSIAVHNHDEAIGYFDRRIGDLEEEVRGDPMAGSDCDGCPECAAERRSAEHRLETPTR